MTANATRFLACLFVATLACSVDPAGEVVTYRDAKRGIQLEHPADWAVEELAVQNVLLVMSPIVEADWQANVFLELRTDLDPEEPIESRLDALVTNLAQHKEAFALKSSQRVIHPSGLEGGELVYTHVTQGVPLTDRELILWLPGGQTLFVTGSAVTALWDKYEADLDVVLTSVRPL
jgi:hypothetical protein